MDFYLLNSSLERLQLLINGPDGQKDEWTKDDVKSIMKEYQLGCKLKGLEYVGDPADRVRAGLPEQVRYFAIAFSFFGFSLAQGSEDPTSDFEDAADYFAENICREVFKSRMISKLRWVDFNSIPREAVRDYVSRVESLSEDIYGVFENFFLNEGKKMFDLFQKGVNNCP